MRRIRRIPTPSKFPWPMATVVAAILLATAPVAADHVFALSADGVLRRLADPVCAPAACEWLEVDRDPRAVALAATVRSLFRLRNDGSVWIWNGAPCEGAACSPWTLIDGNPATTALAANTLDLFQLHSDGTVWRWLGSACEGRHCPSWELVGRAPGTVKIEAAGVHLYRLDEDGAIWRWPGRACDGWECPPWQRLDRNPATRQIVASAPGNLYQLHRDGKVWRWDGVPCAGDRCAGWTLIDRNPATSRLVAAPGELYQVHRGGALWRWRGIACTAGGCPWELLDRNPRTTALAAGERPFVSDFAPPSAEPPPLFQVHGDGKVWRWTGSPCSGTHCPHWQRVDNGRAFSRYHPDRGGLYLFPGSSPLRGIEADPPPGPPLFGFVDLHTHPASFLGFGGAPDGRRGMMWGRPAVGDGFRGAGFSQRWGTCPASDHSPAGNSDPVQQMLRRVILGVADARGGISHTSHGAQSYASWPSSLVISHQQIDVPWLRRAHAGGLRAIVAAAVDNELVDTAYDWDLGDAYGVLRTAFSGGNVRSALGMPRPGFAFASATRQLDFIRQMVAENAGWMAIARSGAEARRIIESGRLAVVLGVEMDNLTPAEMDRLVDDGVRFVTPIHFVDNRFGGAAAYETMFSLLNGVIGAPADGGVPQPYSLVADSDVDFFARPLVEPFTAEIDDLTRTMLGWAPFGSRCPRDATVAGTPSRPGCTGRRNRRGLTAGGDPVRRLIGRGVMVDLAHMSQQSQSDALRIAESMRCPVVNSHTGVRSDRFDPTRPGGGIGNERAMRESDARRLLRLGGVVGVGTGTGEVAHPRRIYYNAGNPLIQLSGTRPEWRLDLRQPETRQAFVDGDLREYRVIVRLGHDGIDGGNELRARLLGRSLEASGGIAPCVLNPGRAGHGAGTELAVRCALPAARTARLRQVEGLRLEHDGSGDNVDVDEVRLEGRALDGRGWITLVQRTGGREGEVVRLKGRGPADLCRDAGGRLVSRDLGSHFWETRLLPEAAVLRNMSGLVVQTFTNEDDLGGSAPAVVGVTLSGHRDPMRQEFAAGGISTGTCALATVPFDSGLERADGITSLRLSTGPEQDSGLLPTLIDLRNAARAGRFSASDAENFLLTLAPAVSGLAIAQVTSAAGFVLADPATMALNAFGIWAIAALASGSHDNWSTQVSIRARTPTGDRPLLVNYNPVQRLKRDQPDSVLFRGLPEKIDPARRYGGLVVEVATVNEVANGAHLAIELRFEDGVRLTRPVAPGRALAAGTAHRVLIPFDRRRLGEELHSFVLHGVSGTDVRIRALDVGLVTDPVESWAGEVARVRALGDFPTQVALGTDLSGFEALIPFTAVTLPAAPTSGVARWLGSWVFPWGRRGDAIYSFDIEAVAGRADPARGAMRLPAPLATDTIGGRSLSLREHGLSTIGQLPDLVYAAAQVDPTLGPGLFSSVDGFVRAWERLDRAAASGGRPRCW